MAVVQAGWTPVLERALWTPESRAVVGACGAGPALNDEQFSLVEPWLALAKPGGRPRSADRRCLRDGLFSVVRTGRQWRHLPPPLIFPPWQTVSWSFRTFEQAGAWEAIRHHLVLRVREQDGRDAVCPRDRTHPERFVHKTIPMVNTTLALFARFCIDSSMKNFHLCLPDTFLNNMAGLAPTVWCVLCCAIYMRG